VIFKLASAVRLGFAAFVALALLAVPALAADPTFPELNGRRVIDDAHVLSAADQSALTDKLAALEAKTTDQFVVVTVPSLQGAEIEDYGYKLGRKWEIGQKGANNGVILLVAPTEHKVRIEVGYGLEDVLTDALSSVILQEKVLPKFRDKDYPAGIKAGADAIITQLSLEKGEAIARGQATVKAAHGWREFWSWFPHLFIPFLALALILAHRLIPQRMQPRWFRGGFYTNVGGGSGGWSGGGGGGFSGGGGSFGGGGASGGW
jgi:uncharacterized protein